MDIDNIAWIPFQELFPLQRDEVFLFYGLDTLFRSSPIAELLTVDEILRANRFVKAQRSSWIACHAALRLLCSKILQTNSLGIVFHQTDFGKPFLRNTSIHFNLSHCKNSFLIAFSLKPIGVDIEPIELIKNHLDVVNFAFSEEERIVSENGTNKEQFYAIWTAKEAFCKATGEGLVDGLSDVNVVGFSSNAISDSRFIHKAFFCPNGEIGSVVFDSATCHIRFFHLVDYRTLL